MQKELLDKQHVEMEAVKKQQSQVHQQSAQQSSSSARIQSVAMLKPNKPPKFSGARGNNDVKIG